LAASRTDEVKRHQNSVFHAEAQKTVGHMVTDRYMDKHAKFLCNKDPEQVTQVFQMFKKSLMCDFKLEKNDTYTIVLIDYTKHGTVTQDMVDWTIGIAGRVLEDTNSVVVVVAPVLDNQGIDGETGERARIEKKLRAKDISPALVTLIACGPHITTWSHNLQMPPALV
jgi:hypothetical protein